MPYRMIPSVRHIIEVRYLIIIININWVYICINYFLSYFQFPDDPGMHNTGSSSQSHYSRSTRHHMQQPSSFFQNVKRYLLAVVVGFVLICVGVAVVFWNEVYSGDNNNNDIDISSTNHN